MLRIRSYYERKALQTWLRLRHQGFSLPPAEAQQVFSGTEIWVIAQLLGAIPSNTPVPTELVQEQADLVKAKEALLKSRLIYINSTPQLAVAPFVDALVRPTLAPNTVFIAMIADNAAFGSFTRTLCFSCLPDKTIANWVDEQNVHHFEAYNTSHPSACILAHLWQVCNLDFAEYTFDSARLSMLDVERLARHMRQTVTLIAANGVQETAQASYAMGWFISEGCAWLMAQGEETGKSAPRLADQVDLGLSILTFVEEVLAQR